MGANSSKSYLSSVPGLELLVSGCSNRLPCGGRNYGQMNTAEQQQQQQAAADEVLQFQQQQAAYQRRRSSYRGGGGAALPYHRNRSYSGVAAITSFNDDDPLEGLETVNNNAEPQPEPSVAGAAGANATLSLSARVEYTSLQAGLAQSVFGLVTVRAAEQTARSPATQSGESSSERQPMDIVCVLDVSGSMRSNGKIEQVADAVRFIIDQCNAKDRLSIVTFESNPHRVLRLCKMDQAGKNLARGLASSLQAGGGTNIASGLDVGCSVMEQRRQRNTVAAMLLLTDGQDGQSAAQIPALLSRARQANCTLYTFGFGADHDARLLGDIAEQAYTPFTFVENTEDIREAFAGTVGGLASMAARDVSLKLTCVESQLKAVHTGFSVQRAANNTEATVTIPDMFAGERRDILVELSVGPRNAGADGAILDASVRYCDLANGATVVQTAPTQMTATYADEAQPEQEPDEEVTGQRERVEVSGALEQAMQQCDRGHFAEAQQLLSSTTTRLSRSKKKSSMAAEMNSVLQQELVDAQTSMCSRGLWESGGRAEVQDKKSMHSFQRTTNTYVGSRSGPSSAAAACESASSRGGQKKSKQMYSNSVQSQWISTSKMSTF